MKCPNCKSTEDMEFIRVPGDHGEALEAYLHCHDCDTDQRFEDCIHCRKPVAANGGGLYVAVGEYVFPQYCFPNSDQLHDKARGDEVFIQGAEPITFDPDAIPARRVEYTKEQIAKLYPRRKESK